MRPFIYFFCAFPYKQDGEEQPEYQVYDGGYEYNFNNYHKLE